jgi:hypothetical protein
MEIGWLRMPQRRRERVGVRREGVEVRREVSQSRR